MPLRLPVQRERVDVGVVPALRQRPGVVDGRRAADFLASPSQSRPLRVRLHPADSVQDWPQPGRLQRLLTLEWLLAELDDVLALIAQLRDGAYV